MATKERETKIAPHLDWRPKSPEKQLQAFYTGLQQAVDEVDWAKVKLPELRDAQGTRSPARLS